MKMKHLAALMLGCTLFAGNLALADEVVGTETLGISVNEDQIVAFGRSVTKEILHKDVYNDHKQKLGVIEDIILSPEHSASYAVIDIGNFLGIPRHPVLVSFSRLHREHDSYILKGATRAAMKSLPTFHYNPANK